MTRFLKIYYNKNPTEVRDRAILSVAIKIPPINPTQRSHNYCLSSPPLWPGKLLETSTKTLRQNRQACARLYRHSMGYTSTSIR